MPDPPPPPRSGFAIWGVPILIGSLVGLVLGGSVGAFLAYGASKDAWSQASGSNEGAVGAVLLTPFFFVIYVGGGSAGGLGAGLVAGIVAGVMRASKAKMEALEG